MSVTRRDLLLGAGGMASLVAIDIGIGAAGV
jgi:hypothetical protein